MSSRQYTDPETGLQYLRARYYDPATAQFLTRDPMATFTRDAYGYAARSPLDHSDPSGLDGQQGPPSSEQFLAHQNASTTAARTACLDGKDATTTGTIATLGGVTVFRVTLPAETAQIARSEAYEVVDGIEGKYFFLNEQDAIDFAKVANENPDSAFAGDYALTSGALSDAGMEAAEGVSAAGEGEAIFVAESDLPEITEVLILIALL